MSQSDTEDAGWIGAGIEGAIGAGVGSQTSFGAVLVGGVAAAGALAGYLGYHLFARVSDRT